MAMALLEKDHVELIKEIDTEQIYFVWRADNILHYYIKENCFITMKDIEEVLQIVLGWGESNMYLHLFEGGYNSSIDTDVRAWASSDAENKHTVADAIIVKNMAQRIVGNFYIQFNRPVKPTKLFTGTKEAIVWLQSQGEKFEKTNPDWYKQTII